MPRASFKDFTREELALPPEPCYWCGVGIQNPDTWPCCHRIPCQANTLRWFLKIIGYVPQRPELDKEDLFSLEMQSFVLDLARPRPDISKTAFEYVIPPAARRIPLSILPKDRRILLQWCLEAWLGYKHARPLPEYLRVQIERRIARSKAEESMKIAVEDFAKQDQKKESARIRRLLKKAEGIGA